MKVKVRETTGIQLDYLVTSIEDPDTLDYGVADWREQRRGVTAYGEYIHRYHQSWNQGGPIIERELICLDNADVGKPHHLWFARIFTTQKGSGWDAKGFSATGHTPLIAAMRAFVASKLGDEVEVPEELL